MNADERELAHAFAAAAAPESEAGRAAAAVLAVSGGEVDDWTALFVRAGESGRWEEALEVAHAAIRRRPESAALALLVPEALGRLRLRDEELEGYHEVAAAFPDEFEAHDRLAHLYWYRGYMPAAVRHVELALERGLRVRDHVVEIGVTAATLMGRFDDARRAAEFFDNPDNRARNLAKVETAELDWREQATVFERDWGRDRSVPTLQRMLEAGLHDLVRHAAVHVLLGRPSIEDLEFLVHRMDPLGPAGWFLSQWAGFQAGQDFPDHPASLWSDAGLLLQRGDFTGAARRLLRLLDTDVHPEVLMQWLTFAAAGGGLSSEELSAAADRAALRGHRDEAWRLVQSFLKRRRGPGALDVSNAQTPESASAPGHALRRFYRPLPHRRPRIAVCVSGQLRSYLQTWPGTRAALGEWDATVFLSTWRNTGNSAGALDQVDRLLPPTVMQRLPLNLRRRTVFASALPGVLAAMTPAAQADEAELTEVFGTPHVQVHDEVAFEAAHCQDRPGLLWRNNYNQAKMLFTMTEANAMKAAYELENGFIFDAVLRMRPDRRLARLGAADVERAIERRIALSDYLHAGGLGDQVLLSSSEVADLYADIWPRMNAHGSPQYFPGASGRHAEHLLAEHLLYHGVEVGALNASHVDWLTGTVVPLPAVWAAVRAELTAPPRPEPEARPILRAFIEAAAEAAEADPAAYPPPDPEVTRQWSLSEGLSPRALDFLRLS